MLVHKISYAQFYTRLVLNEQYVQKTFMIFAKSHVQSPRKSSLSSLWQIRWEAAHIKGSPPSGIYTESQYVASYRECFL